MSPRPPVAVVAFVAGQLWTGLRYVTADETAAVLANAALLAGHVRIGDHTFVGGGAVLHQFVRVGDLVKPVSSYRLRVPIVLGDNVNFTFPVFTRAGLGAGNPLVAASLTQVVTLRGILTKVAAV